MRRISLAMSGSSQQPTSADRINCSLRCQFELSFIEYAAAWNADKNVRLRWLLMNLITVSDAVTLWVYRIMTLCQLISQTDVCIWLAPTYVQVHSSGDIDIRVPLTPYFWKPVPPCPGDRHPCSLYIYRARQKVTHYIIFLFLATVESYHIENLRTSCSFN